MGGLRLPNFYLGGFFYDSWLDFISSRYGSFN